MSDLLLPLRNPFSPTAPVWQETQPTKEQMHVVEKALRGLSAEQRKVAEEMLMGYMRNHFTYGDTKAKLVPELPSPQGIENIVAYARANGTCT